MSEALKEIEEAIGYSFIKKQLLVQAFTRRSYSHEHEGILDNEQLEFYGDACLNMFVSKKLCHQHGNIESDGYYHSECNEGQLSRIRASKVDKENLSNCIGLLDFAKYLRLGSSDEKNKVRFNDSVAEDLFESIIGAVAVDSDWNTSAIDKVCEAMLEISDFDDDYIWLLEDTCEKLGYNFQYYPPYPRYGGNELTCSVYVNNESYEGTGYSKYAAKMDAAREAYYYILPDLYKFEVGDIGEDNPVIQLNKLYQKDYITEPKYDLEESYDEDGNPLWIYYCELEDPEYACKECASTKKEAKQNCARRVLMFLYGEDD